MEPANHRINIYHFKGCTRHSIRDYCMKKECIALFTCLAFSLNLVAVPYGDGDNREKIIMACNYLWGINGYSIDYNKAFTLFTEVDNSASVPEESNYLIDAWYGLGICYYWGYGTEQNYEKAFDKFLSLDMWSAVEVLPDAGFYYGMCWYNGHGTRQDYIKARKAFHESARYGSGKSRRQLGLFMLNNVSEIVDTEKDGAKILNWLNEESNKNNSEVQQILAELYLNGRGCPKDTTLAILNLSKSADNGNVSAGYKLVHDFYLNGWTKYKDVTKALQYIVKFANQGNAYFQYDLAVCYNTGSGVAKNEKEALFWYEKAASGSCPDALLALGNMYYEGKGVNKNYSEALEYYKKYLIHRFDKNPLGSTIIRYVESTIGDIYYEGGYGVKQDYEQAVKYYEEAGSAIKASSARKYAICHKWGYGGLLPSNKKALEWLQKAAELGDDVAKTMLQEWTK